jgi:hypothetical protein
VLQVIADPITWYGVAAVVYAGLGIQVFMPGMGSLLRMQRLLLAAAGLAWALYFGLADRLTGLDPVLASDLAFSLDFGLLLAWFALLSRLLRGPYKQSMPETVRRGLYLFWGLIALASVVGLWLSDISNLGATILAAMLLAAALACLAMVTQLHRDSPVEDRAAMRAFVAAGVLLAAPQAIYFSLISLSGSLPESWSIFRTLPVGLAGLLLMRATQIRPQWSLAVFVSPQARAYAPRFLGSLGLLLLLLGQIPVLRALPPEVARLLAFASTLGLGLPLFALLFSESLGARLRVFISKHFLPFRYDYREEWLRLIETLAAPVQRRPLPERTIVGADCRQSGRHPVVTPAGRRAL